MPSAVRHLLAIGLSVPLIAGCGADHGGSGQELAATARSFRSIPGVRVHVHRVPGLAGVRAGLEGTARRTRVRGAPSHRFGVYSIPEKIAPRTLARLVARLGARRIDVAGIGNDLVIVSSRHGSHTHVGPPAHANGRPVFVTDYAFVSNRVEERVASAVHVPVSP